METKVKEVEMAWGLWRNNIYVCISNIGTSGGSVGNNSGVFTKWESPIWSKRQVRAATLDACGLCRNIPVP
jgi:hypothetical protein